MKDRLKFLRKELGLTQEKFAERLNIKRNTIANYEIGRNEPIDAVVSLICKEFHVNEIWLRTGSGEIFKHYSEETAYFVEELLKDEGNPFSEMVIDMIKTYYELDQESQAVVRKYFGKVREKRSTKDASVVSGQTSVSKEDEAALSMGKLVSQNAASIKHERIG